MIVAAFAIPALQLTGQGSTSDISGSPNVDTGRMIRHSGSYESYYLPSHCVAAALNVESMLNRSMAVWGPYDPLRKGLNDSSVRVAKKCGENIVAELDDREFLNVIRFLFVVGDGADHGDTPDSDRVTKVDSVVSIWMARIGDNPQKRADAFSRLVRVAIEARPMRLHAARKWLQNLDAYDFVVAPTARFASHRAVATHWFYSFDVDGIESELSYFEKWIQRVEPIDQLQFLPYADALHEWNILANMHRWFEARGDASTDNVRDAVKQFKEGMASFPGTDGKITYNTKAPFFENLAELLGSSELKLSTTSAVPFPSQSSVGKSSKAVLYYKLYPNCGMTCYSDFSTLRRLDSLYGNAGLEIRFVATTSGYFKGRLMPSPDEEMKKIGEYLHQFLGFSSDLYIYPSMFHTLKDRRRRVEPNAFDLYYRNAGMVLTDEEGTVVMAGNVNVGDATFFRVPESALSRFIARLIGA